MPFVPLLTLISGHVQIGKDMKKSFNRKKKTSKAKKKKRSKSFTRKRITTTKRIETTTTKLQPFQLTSNPPIHHFES